MVLYCPKCVHCKGRLHRHVCSVQFSTLQLQSASCGGVGNLAHTKTHTDTCIAYSYFDMQKTATTKIVEYTHMLDMYGKLLKHTSAKNSKMAMVINLNDRKVFH